MADHVSPDTGRRLREAGMRHEWQQGDWTWVELHARNGVDKDILWGGEALVVKESYGDLTVVRPPDKPYTTWGTPFRHCTWLPTTGQLLGALERAKIFHSFRRGRGGWEVRSWGGYKLIFVHASLPETLAEVWLRVHGKKGGEG